MSKTLLNSEQAAAILGVTRPGFVKMFQRKEIKAEITVGRQTFFSHQSVRALKKKRLSGAKKNGSKPKKQVRFRETLVKESQAKR